MAFELLSKLVNAIRGGVKGALEGTADVGSAVIIMLKDLTVTTVKGTSEFVAAGIRVPASVVKGAVAQSVHSAKELGLDVADVAIEAVKGAVSGVMQIGGDTVSATKNAVLAAFDAAKEIGDEAADSVKNEQIRT